MNSLRILRVPIPLDTHSTKRSLLSSNFTCHSHKKDIKNTFKPTSKNEPFFDLLLNKTNMRVQIALLFLAVPAFARRGVPEVPTPPAPQSEQHHKVFLPYSWGITQPSTPLPKGESEKKANQVKLVKDEKKGAY